MASLVNWHPFWNYIVDRDTTKIRMKHTCWGFSRHFLDVWTLLSEKLNPRTCLTWGLGKICTCLDTNPSVLHGRKVVLWGDDCMSHPNNLACSRAISPIDGRVPSSSAKMQTDCQNFPDQSGRHLRRIARYDLGQTDMSRHLHYR